MSVSTLEKKEREFIIREKKLESILVNTSKIEYICLLVGKEKYFCTKSILLSVKDSYFHGLLNADFENHVEGLNENENVLTYIIPRSGDSFKYVLEFLTYGELVSEDELIGKQSLLKKLHFDADFYILKALKDQTSKLMKIKQIPKQKQEKSTEILPFAKWQSNTACSNGNYWAWNIVYISPSKTGYYTKSADHKIITVHKKGKYRVNIRCTGTTSTNSHYISLYINSSPQAYCYNGQSTGYLVNWQINDIFSLNAGARLQVYWYTNGSSNNTIQSNSFSIEAIEIN